MILEYNSSIAGRRHASIPLPRGQRHALLTSAASMGMAAAWLLHGHVVWAWLLHGHTTAPLNCMRARRAPPCGQRRALLTAAPLNVLKLYARAPRAATRTAPCAPCNGRRDQVSTAHAPKPRFMHTGSSSLKTCMHVAATATAARMPACMLMHAPKFRISVYGLYVSANINTNTNTNTHTN
jgi:hypothetical protein